MGRARGHALGRVAVTYTARVPGALAWYGLMPVVPMTTISCLLNDRSVADDAAPIPPKTLQALRVLDRTRVIALEQRVTPHSANHQLPTNSQSTDSD